MSEALYKLKGKNVWTYTKRDYEDTVRELVDKLKVGKDKPKKLF